MLLGWDYVELRGTFIGPKEAERGLVEFVPTDRFEQKDGLYEIIAVPFAVSLDPTGSFAVKLIATDNLTLRNNPWQWVVKVKTKHLDETKVFSLPAAEPLVDYVQLEEL